MNCLKFFVLFVGISVFCSCSSESPFVSKEEVEELIASRNPFRYTAHIAAIIDNDIYYFNHVDSVPQRLTHTPEQLKTHIRLSSDKTKMVYLNENRTPVIIDVNGEILKTLTEYSRVKQLGWTNNDKSIYLLVGNEIFIYGENVPTISPEYPGIYDELLSFSMDNNGNQAYITYEYMGYTGQSGNFLRYYSPGADLDTTISVVNDEFIEFGFVDFTDQVGSFIIGYKNAGNKLFRIYCHENNRFRTEYYWEDEFITSPVFNAENEILIYGVTGSPSYIKVVYLGTEMYYSNHPEEIKTIDLTQYSSTATPIYLDWKQ